MFISAVALVAAQAATSPTSVSPAGAANQEPEAEKRVCKKVQATGSRIRAGKTCMTKAEWAQRTKDDQKALTDMQNRIHKTN